MTAEELERLAATDAEMPDDLEMPEQLLFLTLRTLYKNFRSGAINKEQGKREKSRILVAYRSLRIDYQATEYHNQVRKRLSQNIGNMFDCGCEHCQKMLRIFNGLDRQDIPEDIKMLNTWNENLREMIKKCSDRNAELATTIDKVRWALEKNDIERVKEIVKK